MTIHSLTLTAITSLAIATAIGTNANAVPPFNDPSFENGGSTTMVDWTSTNGSFYNEGTLDGNHQLSTMPAGVWTVNDLNNSGQTMALAAVTALNPAGATGSQYIWGSQTPAGWGDRTFFQYVQDNKATKGKLTISIDYWAHIRSGTGGDGQGDIVLQVFAFDDPSTTHVDTGNDGGADRFVTDLSFGASRFITSGSAFTTVDVVDASTGFQTISTSLDLGAGYNYIGVAITVDKFDNSSAANGDTVAFDNMTVTVADPRITHYLADPGADQSALTWTSVPGDHYGLYWSEDLVAFTPMHDANAAAILAHATAAETTYGPFDHPLQGADRLFFAIGSPDLEAPALVRTVYSESTVTLTFSEAMYAAAIDSANFTVTPNGGDPVPVTTATLSEDGRTVTLTLGSPLETEAAYTVTMNNLTDPSGRELGDGTAGNFETWDNHPTGIKVFILAGQSNMVGYGRVEGGHDGVAGGIGSLRYLAVNNASYPDYDYATLLDNPSQPSTSSWAARSDVKVWWDKSDLGNSSNIRKGDLGSTPFGSGGDEVGPEYGFGQIIGDYYSGASERPVLIIKAAWGGKSLSDDFRPPTAVLDRGGAVGPYYTGMLEDVRAVLDNLETQFPAAEYPEFAAVNHRYQIAGFGWHQGVNDRGGIPEIEYKENLPDLISDVRAEFGNPDLPFTIASTGQTAATEDFPYPSYALLEQAQLWAAGVDRPASVLSDDTRHYWRDSSVSPTNRGYHWNHNAESYFLIGKGLAENMKILLTPEP